MGLALWEAKARQRGSRVRDRTLQHLALTSLPLELRVEGLHLGVTPARRLHKLLIELRDEDLIRVFDQPRACHARRVDLVEDRNLSIQGVIARVRVVLQASKRDL